MIKYHNHSKGLNVNSYNPTFRYFLLLCTIFSFHKLYLPFKNTDLSFSFCYVNCFFKVLFCLLYTTDFSYHKWQIIKVVFNENNSLTIYLNKN